MSNGHPLTCENANSPSGVAPEGPSPSRRACLSTAGVLRRRLPATPVALAFGPYDPEPATVTLLVMIWPADDVISKPVEIRS
jgi:hypothetical protein